MTNLDIRKKLFEVRNALGNATTKARKVDNGLAVDLAIIDDQLEALIEALRDAAKQEAR